MLSKIRRHPTLNQEMRSTILAVLAEIATIVASCLALADEPATAPADRTVASDKAIEALLAPILEKHKAPGLIAAVVNPHGLVRVGAVGVRKKTSPEPLLVTDKIHIGSDTKAMTATLLAMLVAEEKLSWTTTLGEILADLPQLDADLGGATLEQLLTHRAGLPANVNYSKYSTGSIVEQREALTKEVLGQHPQHPPGTKFLYSNVGYVIAGHVAERVTDKSWEDLMNARLFEPLGMSSAGFGPPGTKGQVDQPWGHGLMLGVAMPLQMDNPPVLGPAGTVHCSFADWAKFVSLHLRAGAERVRGSGFGVQQLLTAEAFKKLHTPPAGGRYALGWGIDERPYITGPLLIHTGSNNLWFATAVISPRHQIAFLVASNSGEPAAHKACNEALQALVVSEHLPQ